jgi:O-antigen ligase
MDSSALETAAEPEGARGVAGRARTLSRWLDGALVVWLFALALFAPHSIAATQISWMCGLLVWGVRWLVGPRRRLPWRTPVDYALLGFFILTFISALFSYDQTVSLGKLRGASLFTIVYLVAVNVRSARVLRGLALVLVASCMVSVVYTMGERVRGRGVKLEGVRIDSPLSAAVFRNGEARTPTPIQSGDTVLEVDGRKVYSPEELAAALDFNAEGNAAVARVKIYRVEWMPVLEVPRGRLLVGQTPMKRLGVESWTRGRDWRAAGFYGHYVTYAEALQLIASLAFGLFIALPRKRGYSGALLLLALLGLSGALLLTVTRASWLSLVLSALVIVLAGTSRRTALVVAACLLPLVLGGWLILKQQRNVGFYDSNDQSITWRQTVWRESVDLLASRPRHMLVGVGMDSIKRHWREWGLFEGGRIPVGHLHSTPLQLAVERGLPALVAWLLLLGLYARMLWRLARGSKLENWMERGIVLGALGGLVGFFASGMVHYNLGDSEVAMIFYFIMGLSLVVERQARGGQAAVVRQVNQSE